MAPAVSKHEANRNPLAEGVGSVIRFIQARRALVLGIVLGLALLGTAAAGYSWYQGQREAQARRILADAQFALRSDAAGTAPRTDEAAKLLRQVVDQYPRTSGAEEALLRLGNLESTGGKPDAAAEAYGQYLRQYPRGRFAMMAAIGRAYALEAKGDLDGAAQTLSEAIDRQADSPLAGEGYTALGRIYESQKKAEAAGKIYNQLIEKFPNTQWAQHATQRMTALKTK